MQAVQSVKTCAVCGAEFAKPGRLSWADWTRRKACGGRCGRALSSEANRANAQERARRREYATMTPEEARVKTLARLESKSMPEPMSGCVLWLGAARGGYGRVWCSLHGGQLTAHRVAYESVRGPVPKGMELDHLCRNKLCVNPDHLEPVTTEENIRRALPFREVREECPNGHRYDVVGVYETAEGRRKCAACARERSRRYRARKCP